MRADGHAFCALDADFFVPDRDFHREIAFFVLRRAGRERAVHRERADGQFITFTGGEPAQHVPDELRRVGRDGREQVAAAIEALGQRHFVQMFECVVHGLEVHGHDFLAFFAVGFLDGIFDGFDGLVARQHAGKREETDLHDGVDASAHAAVARHPGRVNHVKLRLLGDERFLRRRGQPGPDFLLRKGVLSRKVPPGTSGLTMS